MDHEFEFIVDIPVAEALNFVHRMRVELSRFRDKVRKQSRTPKHFKMLYVRAEPSGTKKCIITLKKSLSRNDVSEELDSIFDVVAGGPKIDV